MTRQEAIQILRTRIVPTMNWQEIHEALDMAIEALQADRPTGEWEGYKADNPNWLRTDGTPIFLVCDKCHYMVMNNGSANWNYCPNCGADMRNGM